MPSVPHFQGNTPGINLMATHWGGGRTVQILPYEFSNLMKYFALPPSQLIRRTLPIVLVLATALVGQSDPVAAQDETFSREQVQAGSRVYAQRCATCHGRNMRNPDEEIGAFDLRYFPRDEHDRFIRSVTDGKNSMPAWGAVISLADIEALWAYVCAGEK
jgi:mono/diheme cytochrome c family protein